MIIMVRPICTLTNMQFCWNMKVDGYNNTIGEPEYFAKHYHRLGYRIRIEQNRRINDRPIHICTCEDFNPFKDVFWDVAYETSEASPYKPIVEPEPQNEATEPLKEKKKQTGPYKRTDIGGRHHFWKREIQAVGEPELFICRFCGCHKFYKKNKFVYITDDGTESTDLPKCNGNENTKYCQ